MPESRPISKFCQELEQALADAEAIEGALEPAAGVLSRVFAVQPDEVAFFKIDQEKGILRFMWPDRLKKIGFLPLSSHDSLAARTAREKKLFVENSFSSKRHASVFEKVKLTPQQETPQPIQKIMSVPIPKGKEVVGVVQVSRKAPDKASPGPDFTKDDLRDLLELAKTLGRRF
ncbi:MAG: GAF domain-containing protein [Desulfuromonadales bacterium]|nr:GAF domain-containing protein [Desulfuromonadales bacterium]NIR33668.1 GAF domain-containing protein [Desulfuromonadales bacterium]NIS42359.1 GAF domain-containing protein [Desulfuromonadales bacterium]